MPDSRVVLSKDNIILLKGLYIRYLEKLRYYLILSVLQGPVNNYLHLLINTNGLILYSEPSIFKLHIQLFC